MARAPVALTAEPDVGDTVFCAEVWRITVPGSSAGLPNNARAVF
ncbi:MAG: hypothetical protein WAN22_09665 [Solirubrobacteraceae bacterium]